MLAETSAGREERRGQVRLAKCPRDHATQQASRQRAAENTRHQQARDHCALSGPSPGQLGTQKGAEGAPGKVAVGTATCARLCAASRPVSAISCCQPAPKGQWESA